MRSTEALLAIALAVSSFPADAQEWPNRPVTIVVPFAPGGNTDITGRTLANELRERTGISFLIENRPGGGGALGATAVTTAEPDGYTLLLGSNGTFTVNQHLFEDVTFDTLSDFQPITQITENRHVVFVAADSPYMSVEELFDAIRERPDDVTFSSAGIASGTHISAELMLAEDDLSAIHIPYPGAGPANIAVVSGEVDFGVDAIASTLPFISNGSVRALAVQSIDRDPLLPDVPTLSETVLPDFSTGGWLALLAPAGTPDEVIVTANELISTIAGTSSVVETFQRQGMALAVGGADALAERIRLESDEVGALIEQRGITAE